MNDAAVTYQAFTSVSRVMTDIFHWPPLKLMRPFIDWNIAVEVYCWQKQEILNGVEPIAGSLKGGWVVCSWTERVGREDSIVCYPVATANVMAATDTITDTPVFSVPATQMGLLSRRWSNNENNVLRNVRGCFGRYLPCRSRTGTAGRKRWEGNGA